jgi:hypothetical protein
MSTKQEDRLANLEQAVHGIAATQKNHGDLLRMMVEGQQEIIKLLTPEPKDGPSLDELLGHVIGQQTELLGYARQIVKSQAQMEQNLPGDVVRAIGADGAASMASNGAARDGRRP